MEKVVRLIFAAYNHDKRGACYGNVTGSDAFLFCQLQLREEFGRRPLTLTQGVASEYGELSRDKRRGSASLFCLNSLIISILITVNRSKLRNLIDRGGVGR